MEWVVIRGGGGVGRSPFASGFPDPRQTSSYPHAGESDAAGGRSSLPELCREGPFDVLQDRPDSGAPPRILDGMQGLRQRQWCSIVAPRCCQYRWISVVWTCWRFGLRQYPPGLGSFLPIVSSCSGRFAQFDLSGVGRFSTGGPGWSKGSWYIRSLFRARSCWGGGGSVANVLFMYICRGIIFAVRSLCTCMTL